MPGVGEDDLHDDGAGDDEAEREAEPLQLGQERVAGRVGEDDPAAGQALGLRGEHVVLADRGDHHVAHLQHPARHRGEDDGEGRQQRVVDRAADELPVPARHQPARVALADREEVSAGRRAARAGSGRGRSRASPGGTSGRAGPGRASRRAASRPRCRARCRRTKAITVAVPTRVSVHGIVWPSRRRHVGRVLRHVSAEVEVARRRRGRPRTGARASRGGRRRAWPRAPCRPTGCRLGNFDMMASTALPGIARGMKKLMVSATQAATR